MRYTLNIEPKPSDLLEDYLEKCPLHGWVPHSLLEIYQEGANCGWHMHEEDMKQVSLDNPSYLFSLLMPDRHQVKYFKQGRVQVGTIKVVVEDFDESKLR